MPSASATNPPRGMPSSHLLLGLRHNLEPDSELLLFTPIDSRIMGKNHCDDAAISGITPCGFTRIRDQLLSVKRVDVDVDLVVMDFVVCHFEYDYEG